MNQARGVMPWQAPGHRTSTRWFTPENPAGERRAGGHANQGLKGRPYVRLPAGGQLDVVDVTASGVLDRIWISLSDMSAQALQGVVLEAFWDGATEPAIQVPLASFFGAPLGGLVPFHSALLSSPEGRSLVSTIPMPFWGSARLRLRNTTATDVARVFYEVSATLTDSLDGPMSYAHCRWVPPRTLELGEPFVMLRETRGRGRLLGCQLGVRTDPAYRATWWGEGEVRMRIDAAEGFDLVGTGVEDYVGSGWGMGVFSHPDQGCLVASPGDESVAGEWTPYRFHLDDPVWFDESIEVSVYAIGGAPTPEVLDLIAAGVPMRPITVDLDDEGLVLLLDAQPAEDLTSPRFAPGWTNFLRRDEYCATAWLYLDRPDGP